VVATRYRELMERLSDKLVGRFRREKTAGLDDLSLELAVAVAADIIGLTNSSSVAMGQRLNRFFTAREAKSAVDVMMGFLMGQYRLLTFYISDVRPAIRARRSDAKEDVISHLIGEGYSNREILTECLTYAAAGMATTREFIVMAAMTLLVSSDLKDRFIRASEAGQIEILEEILRLEPVVSVLKRRVERDVALEGETGGGVIAAGSLVEVDVRAANRDVAAAGACPHSLNPDRVRAPKIAPSVISFGDGPHRCPGASVALQETAIFLDRLLRVPGLKLERAPTKTINPVTAGYELRNAVITCD
jgi:cytochrome P450